MSTLTNPKHMLPFHHHALICLEAIGVICPLCDTKESHDEAVTYYHCPECDFSLHKDCVERLLNQPFHYDHFLKIFKASSLENANHHCHFCQEKLSSVFARCTICNISMDLSCMRNPPPLTVFQPKHHKHSLTLLSRQVTFTCNACGVKGDRDPYVCCECNLMIHKDCIHLPRVININRHDHRVSHTFHLGQTDLKCGVCRKTVDWVYGAFICSRCPGYAVHSKCAIRKEVWDGMELEDEPAEEEDEIEILFKEIAEMTIIHFSHPEHFLRLDENRDMGYDNMRCDCCILPINEDPCYNCMECDFILHKTCASLPRKRRLILHNHKVTLRIEDVKSSLFRCIACDNVSNGFWYECEFDNTKFDARCGSISEPFRHDLHPHDLYLTLEGSKRCSACNTQTDEPFRCTVCDYALCMKCATLPRKVKHRCDDHYLSLCQGVGNSSGDLWCDICETKTNPNVCYYACHECGVNLHIKCVLGDLDNTKVGFLNYNIEVLPNDRATRPVCSSCEARCRFPFYIRKEYDYSYYSFIRDSNRRFDLYYCSMDCLWKNDE